MTPNPDTGALMARLVLMDDQRSYWGTRISLRLRGTGSFFSTELRVSIDYPDRNSCDSDIKWFQDHVGEIFSFANPLLAHGGSGRNWTLGAPERQALNDSTGAP